MKTKIIYKVTCTITQEVYIGATTKDLETRRKDHEKKAYAGSDHPFHEALVTCPEDFLWEQIDVAYTSSELAAKEAYYIHKYDSYLNGYNRDRGGGFEKDIYRYWGTSGEYCSSFASLEEAAKSIGVNKTSISNACLGYARSCGGYFWSYQKYERYPLKKDKRNKFVLQTTLDNVVVTFHGSVTAASRATGISKTSISRVCRGEREHSGGFKWYYMD